jgi:hypothetical protein
MANLYNTNVNIHSNQELYDAFNKLIFSDDRNIFNKLYSKFMFYEKTKHLMGDIVECGVFKGSGLLVWLKLMNIYEPNSLKKVIGFDFFDPGFVKDITKDVDRETMQQVFDRCKDIDLNDLSKEGIEDKILIAGFGIDKFELVKGDICVTSEQFLENRPGFRISILYLDLDLAEPTYATLNNLWNRVVPGGVVVFDEYAYHSWSESDGVDQFIYENDLKLISTGLRAPTAYIVK